MSTSATAPSRMRYAAHDGLRVLQAHDHVDPARLHRLPDVGVRRVRVGVGVRVPHTDELDLDRLGVAHRAQQVAASRRCRCAPMHPRSRRGTPALTAPVGSSVGVIGPASKPHASSGRPSKQCATIRSCCSAVSRSVGDAKRPRAQPATSTLRASWIACQTRIDPSGMSRWRIPRCESASMTAFCTAGRRPDRARLADALRTERVQRRRRLRVRRLVARELRRARHRVVHEVRGERVAVLVVTRRPRTAPARLPARSRRAAGPATRSGLRMRPQSSTATWRSSSTRPVSVSTSTTATCAPNG